jgi:hypothetical protein
MAGCPTPALFVRVGEVHPSQRYLPTKSLTFWACINVSREVTVGATKGGAALGRVELPGWAGPSDCRQN